MADDMRLQIILESQNESSPGFEVLNEAIYRIQTSAEALTRAFVTFGDVAYSVVEKTSKAMHSFIEPIQEDAQAVATAFEDPAKMASEQLSQIVSGFEPIALAAEETANAVAKDFEEAAVKSEEALKSIAGGAAGGKGKEGNASLFSSDTSMNMLWGGMTFTAMGAAGVKAFDSILTPAMAFEKEMRNVQSMTHWNEDTFNQFAEAVQDQAKNLPQTPEQLAKGFYDVVSAGWDAKDAMTIMAESAKAASAGIADNETAANALTSVLSAYGLKAQDVTRITDDMFQAVAVGKITFPELAQNLGQVIPTAAALRVPFDQVAGAMALMTNKGVPAAEAATALNRVLLAFVKPSKQAQDEAHKLGIDLSATAVQTKGLGGVMQELYQKTGGNIEQIQKIVGDVRGLKGVLDITGNGMKDYNSIMAQMGEASGSTDKALAEQAKGMSYQTQLLKNNFDIIANDMANVMRPAFESFIGILQKVEAWFQKLSPAQEKFIMAVTAIITAIGLTVGPFLLFWGGIGQMIIGVKEVVKAFSFFKSGIIKAVKAVAAFIVENPMLAAILAIAAVVAIVAYEIYRHWDQIKAFLEKTWNAIKETASKVWTAIKEFFAKWGLDILAVITGPIGILALEIYRHWDDIKNTTSKVWEDIKTFFRDVWHSLVSAASSGMQSVLTTIHNIWDNVVSFFEGLPAQAMQWGKNLIQGFIDGIKSMIGAVENAVERVVSAAKSFLGFHSPAEKGPGADADTWAPNLVKMFAGGIYEGATNVAAAAEQMLAPLKAAMTGMVAGVPDISGSFSQMVSHQVAVAGGYGSAGMSAPVIQVYVQGNITRNEQELGQIVSRAIWNQAKMQGKI